MSRKRILQKLATDFWTFVAVCVKTFDENEPDPGLRMAKPFPRFLYLQRVAEALQHHRSVIVLKPRQMGLSWLVVAYALWRVLFHRGERALIVSKREKDAFHLKDRATAILDNLPNTVRNSLDVRSADTRGEIVFRGGGAVHFLPASPSIGRTYTANLVILDEAAYLPDAEKMFASLAPTLSGGGRLVALSTPNGVGGLFHELWVKAHERGLHRIRLRWNDHPERDQAWFDDASEALSPRLAAQEYGGDFLQSGSVVFDEQFLGLRAKPYLDGQIKAARDQARDDRDDTPFLIGVDVAEGHEDSDYSVATVLHKRGEEFIQAATLAGRWRPDVFAQKLARLLDLFPGIVGVEKNGPGGMVILELERLGYSPRLYRHREWDERGRKKTRVGWVTSTKSKPLMIGELEAALRTGAIHLSDSPTLEELRIYEYTDSAAQYTSAPTGFHDDRVIALAIAWQMRKRAGRELATFG